MAKQKYAGGLAYSTDQSLLQNSDNEEQTVLEPKQQRLKIKLDTKQRAGKIVTIVSGFEGAGLETLAKSLKNHCGTGGGAKDGDVLIQGDHRDKILQWLLKNGYSQTKKL